MQDFWICVDFLINHSANVLNKALKETYPGYMFSALVNPAWRTEESED